MPGKASVSVFLNVKDVEKATEVYEALGFQVVARHKTRSGRVGWVDLALDGAEIGLGQIDTNDDPAFREWVSTPLGAGVVVYVDVPNVDAAWARAGKAGVAIEQPLESRSYGRVFMINDADGYTIAFIGPAGDEAGAPAAARKPARKAAAKPARQAAGKSAKKAPKKAAPKKRAR